MVRDERSGQHGGLLSYWMVDNILREMQFGSLFAFGLGHINSSLAPYQVSLNQLPLGSQG
jgi:tetrahydromethanopterin S-methyltransferase subunit D